MRALRLFRSMKNRARRSQRARQHLGEWGLLGSRCPAARGAHLIIGPVQRIEGKRVVKCSEIRRGRQDASQAPRVSHQRLQAQSGSLPRPVAVRLVVEPPVGQACRVTTLDEPVAKLVKDHLSKAIVFVQHLVGPNEQRAFAIVARVDIQSSLYSESEGICSR